MQPFFLIKLINKNIFRNIQLNNNNIIITNIRPSVTLAIYKFSIGIIINQIYNYNSNNINNINNYIKYNSLNFFIYIFNINISNINNQQIKLKFKIINLNH